MIDYAFSGVAFANIPINYSRLRTYEAVFGQLWFGVQTPAQLGSTYFALENLGQVLGEYFHRATCVHSEHTAKRTEVALSLKCTA